MKWRGRRRESGKKRRVCSSNVAVRHETLVKFCLIAVRLTDVPLKYLSNYLLVTTLAFISGVCRHCTHYCARKGFPEPDRSAGRAMGYQDYVHICENTETNMNTHTNIRRLRRHARLLLVGPARATVSAAALDMSASDASSNASRLASRRKAYRPINYHIISYVNWPTPHKEAEHT